MGAALYLCAPVRAQEISRKDLALARDFTALTSTRPMPLDPGPGLLVMELDLSGRKLLQGRDAPYVVEFKSTTSARIHQSELPRGDRLLLVELPADRYCLSAISTAEERHSLPCEPPFFDTNGSSIDLAGTVTIRTSGMRLSIVKRDLSSALVDFHLPEPHLDTVRRFLAKHEDAGTSTFFLSSPQRGYSILRLYPEGVAELQELALSGSAYSSGRWMDDGNQLSIRHLFGRERVELKHTESGWRGVEHRFNLRRSSEPVLLQASPIAVSRSPECWSWRNCDWRLGEGLVELANFTRIANGIQLDAEVLLEHRLEVQGALGHPTDVRVIASNQDRRTTSRIAHKFKESIYANRSPLQHTEHVHRTRLRFRAAGDHIEVIGEDLGPAASPP